MKTGYSNFTGELLAADVIKYEDCKALQIVCPACRDAVYKVERSSSGGVSHFLSHYKAVDIVIEECELRVKSISSSEISENNNKARHQRLELFMKVFQDLIYAHPYHRDGTKNEIDEQFDLQNKNRSLQMLYEYIRKNILKTTPEKSFKQGEEYFLEELNTAGAKFATTFPQRIQMRIAHDIWLTLNRLASKKNLKMLFNHAFFVFYADNDSIVKDQNSKDPRLDERKEAIRAIERMMLTAPKKEAKALWDTNKVGFKFIAKNILDYMVSELMKLHYAEALAKEYGDNSIEYPPHDGLVIG